MSRLIPFRFMPGSWGLKGAAFDHAEAHYSLTGEALERRLLDLQYKDEPTILRKKQLGIDLKYDKMTEYDHDVAVYLLDLSGTRKDRAAIDLKHGKIDEYQYEINSIVTEENTFDFDVLAIKLKFGKITSYEHDVAVADLVATDATDRAIRMLEVERNHKRINDYDFEVAVAKLSFDEAAMTRAILDIDLKFGKMLQYDHDVAIADIEAKDANDRKIRLLAVELSNKRIDEYEYDIQKAKLTITDDLALELRLIEIDAEHGKVSDIAAQKATATANGIPWVGVIEDSFDPEKGVEGFTIKLDWNEFWIAELKESGYDGYEEDDVVRAWFQDVCQETSTLDDMKVIAFPNHREGS